MSENGVILVYPKKLEGMAIFMKQLIVEGDKEIEVFTWSEQFWEHNKQTIGPRQKVVFLGKSGANYQYGTKWYFDKFSMKYGWRSNHALLQVKLLKPLEINEFREYAEKHKEEAEATLKGLDGFGTVGVGAGAGAFGLAKFVGIMVSIKLLPLALVGGPVAGAVYLNKLKKYQYPLLVKEFVLEEGGFKTFMEE